jgi:hypothetical protein
MNSSPNHLAAAPTFVPLAAIGRPMPVLGSGTGACRLHAAPGTFTTSSAGRFAVPLYSEFLRQIPALPVWNVHIK